MPEPRSIKPSFDQGFRAFRFTLEGVRVVVIMNPRAGAMDRALVEKKVREALFRCDLYFQAPESLDELKECIVTAHLAGAQALIVCGGDGTVNAVVEPLMRYVGVANLPNICIVPSGTANDLAHEEGISRRIERVAHAILEERIKRVDVIEISAQGKPAYMLTNGGVGVPARTAENANVLRRWVRAKVEDPTLPRAFRPAARLAGSLIQRIGPKIYEALLVHDVLNWDAKGWEVEVDIPGRASFRTQAPFILVNNQPTVARHFTPAPFTSNADGTVNVTLIQPTTLLGQAKVLLDMRMNRLREIGECPSFEAAEIRLRSVDHSRPMTFFGDGEILHRNAPELIIRCLHPGIPIVKMGPA